MTVTKAQFIWGIRQQESGGNYKAGNPSGAEGAYQILASNLPVWTKEALGHVDTATQFLDSPADQDATADKILGDYYDKYGPEKAAAAWYSGDPNAYQSTSPQNGGPSIAAYVSSVMEHAAKAPSGVTLPLSGSTATGNRGGAQATSNDSSSSSGLLSFPAEITGFFTKSTDDLADIGNFFGAFTHTSTWVRIGAGIGGTILVALGLTALALSTRK
jgi:hypothetical protein